MEWWEEPSLYYVIAKGYPSVTISLNETAISHAEVNGNMTLAVTSVRVLLKEGDKLSHTGQFMQIIKTPM